MRPITKEKALECSIEQPPDKTPYHKIPSIPYYAIPYNIIPCHAIPSYPILLHKEQEENCFVAHRRKKGWNLEKKRKIIPT
jgi:hypothetical protein